jgi:hypothetical protein
MRRAAIFLTLLLGVAAAPAAPSAPSAAPITPPSAEAIKPASAEPIKPASAEPIKPASAEPAKPPPAKRPPAEQEFIYQGEATSILGRQVHGPDKQVVGRIVDLLVDDAGQPRAAVIDFGGFMGVGSRTIAVSWQALHFATASGHDTITIDMTQDQIKATPDYHRPVKPADPPVTVAVPPHPAGK